MDFGAVLKAKADATDLARAEASFDKVAAAAVRTEDAVEDAGRGMSNALRPLPAQWRPLPPALQEIEGAARSTGGAFSIFGGQSRMLSQQLSQVAQQGMATGQWAQAFAIQAADIGIAFGPLGAALGVVAMIGLPMLMNAFGGASEAADTMRDDLSGLTAALKLYTAAQDQAVTAAASFDALKNLTAITNGLAEPLGEANSALNLLKKAQDTLAAGGTIPTTMAELTAEVDKQNAALGVNSAQLYAIDTAWLKLATEKNPSKIEADARGLLNVLNGITLANGGLSEPLAKMAETLSRIAGEGPGLQTISESMKGIGDWAFRANGQMQTFAVTGATAAATLDDNLSHTADLSFINLDAISRGLGTALPAAQTLYGVLFSMTRLSFGNLPGALDYGSGSAFGFGGGSTDAALAANGMDPFAQATAAVKHLGGAAGGAAPQIDEAAHSLSDMAKQYVADVQRVADAQVSAIGGVEGALSSLGSGDFGGALSGLPGLGKSLEDVGFGLGGIGSALAGMAPELALVSVLFDAFKTTTTVLADGISGTITALGVSAQQYETIQRSSFFGLFKSTSTTTTNIGGAAGASLTDAFGTMQQGVEDAAAALGIGSDAFKNFTYSFNVSLAGLTDADKQAAIAQAFTAASDAMAQIALAGYEIPATGAAAYLKELGDDLTAFNANAQMLGYNLMDVSVASGVAADNFVSLFGSIDAFNQASTYYFQTFYSTSEQLASVTSDLQSQLGALGISTIPATTEEFKALVDTFQAAGDMDAVAALMQLAPEMANFIDLTGQLTDATTAAADAAAAAAQELADAANILTSGDYFNSVLDSTEQLALLTADFNTQMAALGEVVPTTNDQFQAMVDAANAAGDQTTVAALLALAPEFVQITNLQEQAAQAQLDAAQASQDAADALNALYGFGDQQTYSTLYDWQKAQALGMDAYKAAPPPLPNASPTTQNAAQKRDEQRQQEMMLSTLLDLRKAQKESTSIFNRWDRVGLPAVRA